MSARVGRVRMGRVQGGTNDRDSCRSNRSLAVSAELRNPRCAERQLGLKLGQRRGGVNGLPQNRRNFLAARAANQLNRRSGRLGRAVRNGAGSRRLQLLQLRRGDGIARIERQHLRKQLAGSDFIILRRPNLPQFVQHRGIGWKSAQ